MKCGAVSIWHAWGLFHGCSVCFRAAQRGFTFSQCLLCKKLSWSSGFSQEELPELTAKLLFPAVRLLPTENLTGPLHNEALLPPTRVKFGVSVWCVWTVIMTSGEKSSYVLKKLNQVVQGCSKSGPWANPVCREFINDLLLKSKGFFFWEFNRCFCTAREWKDLSRFND